MTGIVFQQPVTNLGVFLLTLATFSATGLPKADACTLVVDHYREFQLTGEGEPPEHDSPEPPTLTVSVYVPDEPVDRASTNSCGSPEPSIGINVSNQQGVNQGLRMDVVRGRPPDWTNWHETTLFEILKDETITLYWRETSENAQIAYDFDITMTWIDAWGREGTTSAPLHIHIPARDEDTTASCSLLAGPTPASNPLLWAAGLAIALRIRRSRP